ncbi:MAG: family N-acetyltransferase [Bacteroidetes bacterium]|nr:family N-acetyltransferase [Bacteroidota bacterium]
MLNIRPYKPSDYDSCIRIFKSNLPLYFDPTELPLLEKWLLGMNDNKIVYPSNEKEYFFVAELNSEVVACGGYYLPKDNAVAKMAWGMVDHKHHKKGFGKELLMFRIDKITRDQPLRVIELDTSQHTFLFFEKTGFEVVKITENGYGPDLHRYDMIKKIY